jgi:DNA-binding MarR family transcriptional regulator/GNAT superfamily N-acetyltransferase
MVAQYNQNAREVNTMPAKPAPSPALPPANPLIEQIRDASRKMVRELGFMQSTVAGTDYPPSAVHALLEIEARQTMSAAQLADLLGLEKSSISRMIRKLIDAGELKEAVSGEDARIKLLSLTAQGRRSAQAINAYGRRQVGTALERLSEAQRNTVSEGLAAYARALEGQRGAGKGEAPAGPVIEAGYRPGVIGRIAEMHARYYARHAGFGQFFESRVAAGLADFAGRLAHADNGLWSARQGEGIVGGVAIDGQDLGDGLAHLRWFIVDDGMRGGGLGRKLLDTALAFCAARGFREVHLWTFQGLDAARKLYQGAGFVLVEEWAGEQWGAQVMEQKFVKKL